MSMKKRLLAVAAVSALTVATAVPALALDNEFHGLFRVRGIMDNFNTGVAGTASLTNGPRTNSYVEQRARLMYIAKANDDLKLVTHFEIDSQWGKSSGLQGRAGDGGAIGADTTNLETKNIYLDFNIPSTPVNVKLGIQGFDDGYKGVVFNGDAAGLVAKAKMSYGSLGGAYFRFDDATTGAATATNSYLDVPPASSTATPPTTSVINNSTLGYLTRDMVNLNAKINVTKDVKVGVDYYLLYSDVLRQSQDRTAINMAGLNAEAKIGAATLDAFVLYQTGKLGRAAAIGNAQKVSAFAGNVGAKVKAGPGTLRANALYISGNRDSNSSTRNDFQTIVEKGTTSGHAFYAGEMQIMLRNKYNTNSDKAVVFDLNNGGKGLLGGFVGYDLAINKFFMNSNVGAAAIARSSQAGSDYLGTEVNTEIGYKMFDNMTTSVQAGYMLLGDFYKPANGVWAENPYTAKLQVNYTF